MNAKPGLASPHVLGGAGALVAGGAVAAGITAVHRVFPDSLERAVMATGVFCLVVCVLCLMAYPIFRREAAPSELALAGFAAACVCLVGIYLFWASSAVFQRADILIWSESPFVNDIIKFRIGMPLYSAPADFDSFYYTPGSQLLTYAIASLAGVGTSIPAYRVIQVLYAAGAALFVVGASRRLWNMSGAPGRTEPALLWGAVIGACAFLAAGNSITSPFAHLLHNDALSLLVCAAAYYWLVAYAETRRPGLLVLLAIVPAAGFLVKQSLGVWAVLVAGYLVLFDRPRSWPRIGAYGIAAFGLAGAVYAGGRVLWGEPFHHWVVTGLGSHPVSPLRAVEHGLSAWAFYVAGLGAAAVIFRSRPDLRLLGLWCTWLALFGSQTYTSGIAWMLNHMGPGSLLVVPWLAVLLAIAWPSPATTSWRAPFTWLGSAAVCVAAILSLHGLGAVRIPVPSVPKDMDRYVAAVEAEASDQDLSRMLIDHGSWLYLPKGIVMKDRMAAIGEAGYTETGDFSGTLQRIRTHYYHRIIVHDFDGLDFQYDHFQWRQSSGIRAALRTSYAVVRTIPGVDGIPGPWFKTISVLEPRANESEKGANSASK